MAFSVTAALRAWLPGEVGAPCFSDVPDPRPERFVTVGRTGGGASVGVDRPVVAVRAWAKSQFEAEALALAARDAVLLRAAEVPQVRGVRVNSGPYPMPDPESRHATCQVVFDMTTSL